MKIGILFLVFGYFLSQFYRSFLAVLTPVLGPEIGTTAADLSFASGVWFITFAAMQIPVGWALDRFGPRVTASLLLAVGGGGGAAAFALAQGPWAVAVAMALFGVGGAMIGVGSAGNLAGSAPLAWAVETFGWRETMWGLAIVALLIAAALLTVLRDPPRDQTEAAATGSLLSLFLDRNFLILFPMMLVIYAPAAGIRGLWAGPYLEDVFGMDATGIGNVTLIMALAMAIGSFAYGPMERLINSKKKVILIGNTLVGALCLLLWIAPGQSWLLAAFAFTAIGFFGASFPVLIAHGQQFMPRHLTGRGMTLLNLFGIGGVGLLQFITGAMAKSVSPEQAASPEFYSSIFLLFGVTTLIGCAIYSFAKETRAIAQQV